MRRSGAPRRNPSWLPPLLLTAMSCSPPLGLGMLTFDTPTFPIKTGSTSVNVDIEMKTKDGTVYHNGDETKSKNRSLPFGIGMLTLDAFTSPIKKGSTSVNVDLEMKTMAGTVYCKGDAIKLKNCSLPIGPGVLTFDALSVPIKKGSTSANGDLQMKTMDGTVYCNGHAIKPKSCSLPLGPGMLTFDALSLPIKIGSTPLNADLGIKTKNGTAYYNGTGTDWSSHFCMDIKSKPAADESMLPAFLAVSEVEPRAKLVRAWTVCDDSSTHAKIKGLTPSSIPTRKKARIRDTGIVDTDAFGATYDLEMKTMADTFSCEGDGRMSKSCSLPLQDDMQTQGTTPDVMTYNATISACEVSCQQERAFQLQDDTQTRGRMQTFDALTFPIKKVSTSVNVDLSLSALTPRRLARTATKAKATSTAHDLEAKTMISIVSGKGDATNPNSCSLPLEVGMLTFSALTFPIKSVDWRAGAGSHSGSWFWVSGGANGCLVGWGVGADGGAGGSLAGRGPGLDRTPIDLKPFSFVFYISDFYFVIDVGAKTSDSISDAFRVAYRAAFSVCENRPDKLSLGGRESRGWGFFCSEVTRWDSPTHIFRIY